jgi:hypothetical protein
VALRGIQREKQVPGAGAVRLSIFLMGLPR